MIYFIFFIVLNSFFLLIILKWEIKRSVAVPWAILMTVLGTILLFFLEEYFTNFDLFIKILISTFLPILISVLTIAYLFFRDPERIPPNREKIILSPADGKIIYIKEIKHGQFPMAVKGRNEIPLFEFTGEDFISDCGIQIGIAMSFIHVHVNRSPVHGMITKIKRVPGEFKSLKHLSALLKNERVFTHIDAKDIKIGIVQIASRLVRRIEAYKSENDTVTQGERIGIIKFGSQVDLLVDNPDIKICVKEGDEVKAGLTVIAEY